jgi:hypothetical protein
VCIYTHVFILYRGGGARASDPESYAGGRVATGRVSQAEQVKRVDAIRNKIYASAQAIGGCSARALGSCGLTARTSCMYLVRKLAKEEHDWGNALVLRTWRDVKRLLPNTRWRSFVNAPCSYIGGNRNGLYIYIYIQDYNIACGSIWVWNMVSDSKGGT